jgi:hypothetical protein
MGLWAYAKNVVTETTTIELKKQQTTNEKEQTK